MNVMRQERERQGLSRAALSRRAELNPATYGQIESGRLVPYRGQPERIADKLGWPLDRADELLGEIDNANR